MFSAIRESVVEVYNTQIHELVSFHTNVYFTFTELWRWEKSFLRCCHTSIQRSHWRLFVKHKHTHDKTTGTDQNQKRRALCGPRTFQTLIYESTVTVIQMNVARLQNFCDEGACFWDGPLSPLFKELRVWRVTSVIAALYPHSSCKDLRVWARNSFSHSSGNRGPLAYECEELGDSGPLFKSYECEA